MPAAAQGTATLAATVRRLDAQRLPLLSVSLRGPSLDDVFLALTGALRGARTVPQLLSWANVVARGVGNDRDLCRCVCCTSCSATSLAGLTLLTQTQTAKEIKILVLRRQNPTPRLDCTDRTVLAAALKAHRLITSATVLRWHRRLVARPWTYPNRPARPPIDPAVAALVEQMARDNPGRGYQQIQAEDGLRALPGHGR